MKAIKEDEVIGKLGSEGPGMKKENYKIIRGMELYDFAEFMFSKHLNNAYDLRLKQLYQDMSMPLPHYFCYSSHNTYLTGH